MLLLLQLKHFVNLYIRQAADVVHVRMSNNEHNKKHI